MSCDCKKEKDLGYEWDNVSNSKHFKNGEFAVETLGMLAAAASAMVDSNQVLENDAEKCLRAHMFFMGAEKLLNKIHEDVFALVQRFGELATRRDGNLKEPTIVCPGENGQAGRA